MAILYRLLEYRPNKFRNAIIALALSNFPKSSMLISAEPNANLFFPPSELHF